MKKVCVYGASNRPQNWLLFHDALSENDVDFEIIFVGDVRPEYTLPDNIKFVYSPVKPTQCWHIGMMSSDAELCVHSGDDIQFSEHALDIMYDSYKTRNDYKTIVAPKIGPPNTAEAGLQWGAFMPGMSKQYYIELGGFDNRFIFGCAEEDVVINALVSGGTIVWSRSAWWNIFEANTGGGSGGNNNVGMIDWMILEDLWFKTGLAGQRNVFTGKRSDVVMSYVNDDTLLTTSQGFTGRWNQFGIWDRSTSSPSAVPSVEHSRVGELNGDRCLRDLISRFGYKSIEGD